MATIKVVFESGEAERVHRAVRSTRAAFFHRSSSATDSSLSFYRLRRCRRCWTRGAAHWKPIRTCCAGLTLSAVTQEC